MTYEYPAEVVIERARQAREMAAENERLHRRVATLEDDLAECYHRIVALEGELKTMTGNRDRGMQLNQEALAAWAKDRERFATLEVRIRDKTDWWDRHEPLAAGFRVSDDFRSLLDQEADR